MYNSNLLKDEDFASSSDKFLIRCLIYDCQRGFGKLGGSKYATNYYSIKKKKKNYVPPGEP